MDRIATRGDRFVTRKRSHKTITSSPSPGFAFASSIWEWYKGIARHHRLTLDVLDDAISRILFWLPHGDGSLAESTVAGVGSEKENENENERQETTTAADRDAAAWREVCYGILSLHRLSMHLALEESEGEQESEETFALSSSSSGVDRRNHYGTSIRTKEPPTIAATGVRICLTIVHSIVPSLISLVVLRARTKHKHGGRTDGNFSDVATSASGVRLLLEQVKFLLRLSLLVPYWGQQKQQQHQCLQDYPIPADYGILLNGGLYHSDQPQEFIGIPWDHALALQRRRNYVGERTGWKARDNINNENITNKSINTATGSNGIRGYCSRIASGIFGGSIENYENSKTAIADLLYVFRPMLWAWFEYRYHKSLRQMHQDSIGPFRGRTTLSQWPPESSSRYVRKGHRPSLTGGWFLCLVMDVLSITLLEHRAEARTTTHHTFDPFARDELKRRKLRLLLYALRSPVWFSHTVPALERVSKNLLQRIPVLGNLVETVVWDWLLYYQHPFVAEGG